MIPRRALALVLALGGWLSCRPAEEPPAPERGPRTAWLEPRPPETAEPAATMTAQAPTSTGPGPAAVPPLETAQPACPGGQQRAFGICQCPADTVWSVDRCVPRAALPGIPQPDVRPFPVEPEPLHSTGAR
jgi:hypothetical protein